ncbi:MAG: inverse autotransporter beta domain-containing protein [Gammaproteobacteria bacterium]|nr:inverse autotransporter beta domain-containing protein [Gammaproteobacteria bacterium]
MRTLKSASSICYCFCFSLTLMAATLESAHASSSFYSYAPVTPHIVIDATATEGAIGDAEGLFPVYGNTDRMLFADFSAAYDNHQASMVSPGVGARMIHNNNILGAYVFGDVDQTRSHANFVVFNPGIEWISPQWDAHINGYFPQTHRRQVKNLGYQSNSGNFSYAYFSGHSQYDQQLIQYAVVGNGVDAEVGYSVNMHHLRGRFFAGAYHYSASNVSNISGVQAGFEYPINKYTSVIVSGSHDNVLQNSGAFTLRVSLGKNNEAMSTDVHDRLVDMIPRHLGTLNTASGIPSQKSVRNTGAIKVLQNNLFFFQPGSSNLTAVGATQCTFEHPCVGINQNVINSISQQAVNANLLLAPGNYNFASALPAQTILNIPNGLSLYGKTANYQTAAAGANRPTVFDALQVNGNNTIDSLQIFNSTVTAASPNIGPNNNVVGIFAPGTAAGPINLNNLNVNVTDNGTSAIGIDALGNSNITLSNSTVNATETFNNNLQGALGVIGEGNAQVTIINSSISAVDNSNNAMGNGAIGVANFNASQLTLNGTTVSAMETGANNAADGIFTSGTGNVLLNNAIVNANSTNTNDFGSVALISFSNHTNITINSSILTATGNGSSGAATVRDGGTNNKVLINNSVLNSIQTNSNGGPINAIFMTSGSNDSITLNNSILTATSNTSNNTSGAFTVLNQSNSLGTIAINNSTISGFENGSSQLSLLQASNKGIITVSGSTLNGSAALGADSGLTAFDTSTISILNSNFTISSQSGSAFGIQNPNTANVSFTNTNLTILGNGGSTFKTGTGTTTRTGGTCTVNGTAC